MRRNRLSRGVAAVLVLLLAGCGSTGDEQGAEAPVTNVVTEENVAANDESWLDSGWMPNNWFGDDEPDVGAAVVPPPAPESFSAVEPLPPPVPDAAAFAAIDTTTGTDPVDAAQEPTLGEEELAIMPDAPPPETVAAAMQPLPDIPTELQTDDPSVLAVRYSSDLTPDVVQLLTPNGTVIEPQAIGTVTHWTEEDEGRAKFRWGISGGSASGLKPKFAIGFPIFSSSFEEHGPPTQTQANFKLPDVADYRENWQLYRVVMLFEPGTAEQERLEMLPPHPDALLQ
jgi:hypothetical protein